MDGPRAEDPATPEHRPAALRAWGRLVRLSLAPSAAADVVAGLVYAGGGRWPSETRALWLVPASLGVYHGALVLNDWNDRAHDRATRADRPIPAGVVDARSALLVGFALVFLGVACAGLAGAGCVPWYAGLAAAALAYDFASRGAWLGPLLLAACRAANLGAGMWFVTRADPSLSPVVFLPCALYGAYVFCVSRLGRLEDREDGAALERAPSAWLCGAACALLGLAGLPPLERAERIVAIVLACVASVGLWRSAFATSEWTARAVERAMGSALRRLLVCAAIVALLSARRDVPDAWVAAALVLLGYPLAYALRKSFPPS